MNINLVYLVSSLDFLTFGLIIPVINPHLAALGSSHSAIGVMNSVTALVQFICNPLFGSLSDMQGRRATLLKTLTLGLFSNFLLGLFYKSYLGVFVYRILLAVASQTVVLLKALIADKLPADKQSAVYGKLGAFAALGFIVAPIVSGIVLETDGGFYNLSLLMMTLSATNLGIAFLLPESVPTKQTAQEAAKSLELSVIKRTGEELAKVANNFKTINWDSYWDLFLLKLLTETAFHSFYASFGLVLVKDYALTQKQVGYMLAIHALAIVVFNLIIGTVNAKLYSDDKAGTRRMKHAFLLLIVTFAGFILAPVWWIYALFVVPISAVRVLADTAFNEVLVVRTGQADKGTVMGAFESLFSLSGFTTPLITGLAIDFWGVRAPSLVALLPSVASLYIANKNTKVPKKKTK